MDVGVYDFVYYDYGYDSDDHLIDDDVGGDDD